MSVYLRGRLWRCLRISGHDNWDPMTLKNVKNDRDLHVHIIVFVVKLAPRINTLLKWNSVFNRSLKKK